jgi:hypothetical protein
MWYLHFQEERLSRDRELDGHSPLLSFSVGLQDLEFWNVFLDVLDLKVQPTFTNLIRMRHHNGTYITWAMFC